MTLQVDQTFEVRGVGCVLSGTVVAGRVTLGQQLRLGPDDQGAFKDVTVTCIQREQVRTCLAHVCLDGFLVILPR